MIKSDAASRADGRTKSRARKFYQVGGTRGGVLGVGIINKAEIISGGRITVGADAHRRGFSQLKGRPMFRHNKKEGRLPVDCDEYAGWWIVSDRMKHLLEEIDPEACVFLQCDLQLSDGSMGPPIWLCDVIRVVEALDESASDVEVKYREDGIKIYGGLVGRRIIFRPEIIGDLHLFRLAYATPVVLCDELFRYICRSEKIKGIWFSSIV